MSAGITIAITGTQAVIRAIKIAQREANTAIDKALKKSAIIVEADAKRNAPIKTGRLRSSITHQVNLRKQEAKVGTNVKYAPYIEYGTGVHSQSVRGGRTTKWVYFDKKGKRFVTTEGMRAQPFLLPAYQKNIKTITKLIGKAVKKNVEIAGKISQ